MSKFDYSGRILVTGSQGYIGTELTKELVQLGLEVIGTDIGYFQDARLDDYVEVPTIQLDLRNREKLNLEGFDCIIHLAALSNDPLGEFDPAITYSVNRECAVGLARQAKNQGVRRFIFVSTQSIYGISGTDAELKEDAAKNPVTAYARSKWEAEQEILSMSSGHYVTTAVRPSTVFGWGSRIRNDIIFNNMVSSGIEKGKIEVHTDGSPYRPVVHISDVIGFLTLLLEAPGDVIQSQAFNLGRSGGNYTVFEIAQAASECLGGIPIVLNTEDLKDQRSYRISFEKAANELGFVAKRDLNFGGKEILRHFNNLEISNKKKYFSDTTRLSLLKKLIESGSLSTDLSWK